MGLFAMDGAGVDKKSRLLGLRLYANSTFYLPVTGGAVDKRSMQGPTGNFITEKGIMVSTWLEMPIYK